MKLYIIESRGPYALEVTVVQANSPAEALGLAQGPAIDGDNTFNRHAVKEVTPGDEPGRVFQASYIE